jgi:hypothetical protein
VPAIPRRKLAVLGSVHALESDLALLALDNGHQVSPSTTVAILEGKASAKAALGAIVIRRARKKAKHTRDTQSDA